jgi:hypothetical protein
VTQELAIAPSFFTREVLNKNNLTVVSHPPYLPNLAPATSVSPNDRTERPQFSQTIEVVKAESQAMPNTHIKHDFQEAFINWQKH